MKALFFFGLLIGLLGANSARAGERHYAAYAGDFSARTYECSAACDDCCDDFCDEPCGRLCGRGACGDRTACGPLTFLFSIFNCNTWRGPSCGERYWGDFYSDPPDCCDPCDRCGNYAERSYESDWGSVRGYGSSGGGCSNCNKNRAYGSQPIPQESRVVYPSTRVSRQPTPAKQPSKAVRTR